eukprot:TRINITY_DN22821_c0_g1_i1.p2 TRINITY_DN22821_c0_g1~~TRINITY_DN22821_c0_g1_i1.p2  ORF type:complete len:114 (+),score=24.36 TRINITY_DN22821_c0_g1_i1:510-851(+)
MTAEKTVPFVDAMTDFEWMAEDGDPKPVSYFVSHAWGSKFMDTFRGLEAMEGGNFWFDCFANTQHGERLELLSDDEVFARALQAEQTTSQVLCLDKKTLALRLGGSTRTDVIS